MAFRSLAPLRAQTVDEIGGMGCVLHLPLNEGAGTTAYDRSGYNNHGTIHGATWVNRRYGKALSFDGVDDYVSVPRSPSLNLTELTICAWVYPRAWPPQNCILDRNDYYAIGFSSDGAMWSWLRLPTRVRVSPTPRSLNRWYHLALTYDGVTRRHYVNGEPDGAWNENQPLEVYDSVRLIIGANANDGTTAPAAPSGFFNGIIDDVRIYNRALSGSEIKAIYLGSRIPLLRRWMVKVL